MGFSLDYKDLDLQLKSIVRVEYSFHEFLKDFLVEMAERIIKKTKPRTPVAEINGGNLRRSWELGKIYGWANTLEIEILNGAEYATDIEYGHRIMGGPGHKIEVGWYEGRFMLKISIDEIRKQMPLRWQKEFKQFCIEKGLKFD